MTNVAALLDDSPLRPVLDAGIFVEAKDKSLQSEQTRQAAFVATMRKTCQACRVFAVPNGTHIASSYGRNKAHREGLHKSWPDVGIVWAESTAWIEFKAARTMPELGQVEVLNWLHLRGHPVAVCRTAEGAMRWLQSIGAPVRLREGRL